jgi:dihydrofolate reductase/thymidylate synthase
MGRKTWESIPAKFRPLPGRVNVVLSRTPASLDLPAGVVGADSLPAALSLMNERADVARCFVIGGAAVYREALQLDCLSRVHRTLVHADFACDASIPAELPPHLVREPPAEANCIKEENGIRYEFQTFARAAGAAGGAAGGVATGAAARHEEHQYLDLIRDIMATGVLKGERQRV